jgi:hypothetical protein
MPHLRTLLPLAVVTVGGCASFFGARLPDPAPGVARINLQSRITTCSRGRCAINVSAGDRKLRVETDARLMSPDEALGQPPGIAEKAAGAVVGALVRRAGLTTASTKVGMGTREVYDPEARQFRLSCRVVWIDEEAKGKDEGEDGVSYARYAEGMACDGSAGADSSWRFRVGMSPERDSLASTLKEIGWKRPSPIEPPETAVLVRAPAPPYSIAFHSLGAANSWTGPGQSFRWTVRRPDSTTVGAVYFRGPTAAVAVDVASTATADESIMLRMLGAALMKKLERTR